jgi:hypothetical protein
MQVHRVAAGPDMQPKTNRVAHRARRQEHRGRLAEQCGDPLAQGGDGGVLAALLVANLSSCHRRAHRLDRPRLGIGVQIDQHHR